MGLGYSNKNYDADGDPVSPSAALIEMQFRLAKATANAQSNFENTQDVIVELEERAKSKDKVVAQALILLFSEFQEIKKMLSEVLESR
jgi:hypothetical protein